jgi:hypothetical protein
MCVFATTDDGKMVDTGPWPLYSRERTGTRYIRAIVVRKVMHSLKEHFVQSTCSCILVFPKAHHSTARTPECELLHKYSGY